MFSLFPHCFCCIIAKIKLDDADWTECPSLHAGMHKKSLEMSKKCLSPSESDPTRCNPFCGTSERCGRREAQEAEPEEERLLEMEEEEDVDEEVAIDLSSSSKQQHPEAGSSANLSHSPHRQSGGESDEQSWTLGWGREMTEDSGTLMKCSGPRRLMGSFRDDRNSQPMNRNNNIYLCLYISVSLWGNVSLIFYVNIRSDALKCFWTTQISNPHLDWALASL